MRFATFAHQGSQRAGVVLNKEIADVTSVAPTMIALGPR